MGRIKVTSQNKTGRNTNFKDLSTKRYMNRTQFVKAIESGKYSNYHVRTINGIKTPVSNPDKSSSNNLG